MQNQKSSRAQPRICMPSGRNFSRETFLCGHYEAQDVLVDVDDVDLVCLEPGRGHNFKERWQGRLMYRDVSGRGVFANPGLNKVRLTGEYDLFLARCQTEKDLPHINAVERWKDHCKSSVCWIDELWAAAIPEAKYWLHALRQFDHIFTSCLGTVGPLSQAIGRPIHWLPCGVDTLRFTPYPDTLTRTIDVYSIGRRREGIHKQLLQAARRREIFYIHDTFHSSLANVYDHREHRDYFANVVKRSRYFMVAPGKIDATAENQGQSEVGHRYCEGSAAGAVLLGQAPHGEAFRQMFPWQDAVIRVESNGCDVMEVLAELTSDPARVSAASRRNAVGALLHHDWVYRWKEVLKVAGLKPSPGMLARESRLKDLAAMIAGPVEVDALAEKG
jgi:Glycosyl transferases group 1